MKKRMLQAVSLVAFLWVGGVLLFFILGARIFGAFIAFLSLFILVVIHLATLGMFGLLIYWIVEDFLENEKLEEEKLHEKLEKDSDDLIKEIEEMQDQ